MLAAVLSAFILSGVALAAAPEAAVPETAAKASAKYEEIQVTDGGAVKGRVLFQGMPPALTLSVNQDRDHCPHDGKGERPSPRLRVGPEGGFAGAVVYLKGIAKGKPLAEMKTANLLDQTGCDYAPFVQVVPFKGELTIVNGDPVNHNVHARIGKLDVFNNAMPNTGWPKMDRLTKRMTRPGLMEINCDVHLWMSAYIHVVRHPYYAVTDETGAFRLENIPPGEYELAVWAAGWAAKPKLNAEGKAIGYGYAAPVELSRSVKVTAGGETAEEFIVNGGGN